MPYLVGLSVSDGSAVRKQFDPEIARELHAKITLLTSISTEDRAAIPRVLRVSERRRGGIPDVIGWNIGPFIICERLRDILEELEPGRHDFLPIEIRSEDRGVDEKIFGTYYLILCPIRLDAVIIDETSFDKGVGREGYVLSGGGISTLKEGVCALNKMVIEGHHFWQLPSDFGSTSNYPNHSETGYFCSDELWSRFKSEKMDGWTIEKKCVVRNI